MPPLRVVVIGGGITGTLTARQLALNEHSVTLLEAKHLGAGSSSRSAAGIRQQFGTSDTVVAMRHSVAAYKTFSTASEGASRAIVQNGYLFLHDDPTRFEQATATVVRQHTAGLTEVRALTPSDVAARFPWVDADAIVGATWCPTDGFLRPGVIYQEAAKQAKTLGARVVTGAAVSSAQFSGPSLTAVHTDKGTFEADVFVDATNAWTRRTGAVLRATELPVHPLKRYLWFLHREQAMRSETLGAMPLVVAPTGAYCRPENADTLLFGKKYPVEPNDDFTYDEQDTVDPNFTHNAGIDAVPYEVWMELATVVPALAEFSGVTATTSGFYGTTPDHNPFLGFDPAVPNLIRAVGFSGHGAMMGPFNAAVITALVNAGQDIDAVDLPEGRVPLGVFRIGRNFDHAESMVI